MSLRAEGAEAGYDSVGVGCLRGKTVRSQDNVTRGLAEWLSGWGCVDGDGHVPGQGVVI